LRRISSQGGQVLIILLGALFLGGGAASVLVFVQGQSPKAIKEAVKKAVSDDKRRDSALTIIEDWEKGKQEQEEEFRRERAQLMKIMKRHDAKREEADLVAAKLDASILAMDRSFLDMRFDVKDQLTKAEWEAAMSDLGI
jgi:ParB-like chromosome segregation protein Spo0J